MKRISFAVSIPCRSALLALLAFGVPAAVTAEPITCDPCQLTSGSVGQGLDTMPGLTLVGPGFPGLSLEHAKLALSDWFHWKPGDPLDVALAGSGFEGFGDALPEPGWAAGFDVAMRFTGPEPAFTGPAPWWGGPNVGYGGPFSMSGRITGPSLDRRFLGSGSARLWWAADGSRASYASFFFAEPAPVPEPGTMLLLASGLVLTLARRRLHSRRLRSHTPIQSP